MNTQGQNIKEKGITGEILITSLISETLLRESSFYKRNKFGYNSDLCGEFKGKTFVIEVKTQAGYGGVIDRTLNVPKKISSQSTSDFALIILLGMATKEGRNDWRNGWPKEIEKQMRKFIFEEEVLLETQGDLIFENEKCFPNPKIKFFLINSPIDDIEQIKNKINNFVNFILSV